MLKVVELYMYTLVPVCEVKIAFACIQHPWELSALIPRGGDRVMTKNGIYWHSKRHTKHRKRKRKGKKAMPVQQQRSTVGNNNDENPRYNQVKQRIRHGHGVTVAYTDTIPRKKARICWNNITNELLSVVTKFQIRRFGNARRKTRSELWTNTHKERFQWETE